MPVVSDASPIILLGRVGRLELLPALYGRIAVPIPVFQEVAHGELPASREFTAARWIDVVESDRDDPIFVNLRRELDAGEAAALALARTVSADLVLIDDREGRRAAAALGLAVKGTLGILLAAKREGYLGAVGPIIEALVAEGAWLSPALRRRVMAAAGEQPDRDI